MAMRAKNGIDIRHLLKDKPTLFDPTKAMYKIEMQWETEAQKKNMYLRI